MILAMVIYDIAMRIASLEPIISKNPEFDEVRKEIFKDYGVPLKFYEMGGEYGSIWDRGVMEKSDVIREINWWEREEIPNAKSETELEKISDKANSVREIVKNMDNRHIHLFVGSDIPYLFGSDKYGAGWQVHDFYHMFLEKIISGTVSRRNMELFKLEENEIEPISTKQEGDKTRISYGGFDLVIEGKVEHKDLPDLQSKFVNPESVVFAFLPDEILKPFQEWNEKTIGEPGQPTDKYHADGDLMASIMCYYFATNGKGKIPSFIKRSKKIDGHGVKGVIEPNEKFSNFNQKYRTELKKRWNYIKNLMKPSSMGKYVGKVIVL